MKDMAMEKAERGMERSCRQSGTSIGDLPETIIANIFNAAHPHGKEGNQLLRYAEVCKRWRDVAQASVTSLTLPPWFRPQFVHKHIERLPNLTSLTLDHTSCRSRELIVFFERCARECGQLRELNLIKVRHLDKEVKATLFLHLTSLRALSIYDSTGWIKLGFLWKLPSLERLHIEDSNLAEEQLKDVDQLTSLRSLILRNVGGIGDLPPLTSLPNLETVELNPLGKDFYELPLFNNLPKLHTFEAYGFTDEYRALHLHGLPSLHTLTLCRRGGVGDNTCPSLSGLATLTNLRSLKLGAISGQQPTNIAALPCLERLSLDIRESQAPNCPQLPPLDALSRLTQLRVAGLSSFCQGEEQLDNTLLHLRDLRLSLSDKALCRFLSRQPRSATAITKLDLDVGLLAGDDDDILHFALEPLPDLATLRLSGSTWSPLPPLANLSSLKDLHVSGFKAGDFSLREGFPALTSVSLECLGEGVTVDTLAGATNLQTLEANSCWIRSWPPLAPLLSLRSLDLNYCNYISKLPSLQGLCALEELKVDDCMALARFPALSGLLSLKLLSVLRLEKLACLPPLGGLRRLQTLEITECPLLERVPALSSLASLRSLTLGGFAKSARLPSLTRLSSLRYLNLTKWQSAAPKLDGLSEELDVFLYQAVAPNRR